MEETKYYIAELTETGYFCQRNVKAVLEKNPRIINGEKAFDYKFKLDDDTEFILTAEQNNKLFTSLEQCQNFIELGNKD